MVQVRKLQRNESRGSFREALRPVLRHVVIRFRSSTKWHWIRERSDGHVRCVKRCRCRGASFDDLVVHVKQTFAAVERLRQDYLIQVRWSGELQAIE